MSKRNTPSKRPRTRRGVDSTLAGPAIIILVATVERLADVSLDCLGRSGRELGEVPCHFEFAFVTFASENFVKEIIPEDGGLFYSTKSKAGDSR